MTPLYQTRARSEIEKARAKNHLPLGTIIDAIASFIVHSRPSLPSLVPGKFEHEYHSKPAGS